ncbi:MAG: hypothetical protein HFH26_13065 [Clostridiaceae bacterium]|nr:hypothetical protein [Clostridiaceae bacterium]
MRGKTIKSILSWVLCFAMLSGMLPGALAHSEVNPETDTVEIAFFKLGPDAPAKPSADNAITDYQIEYSADTLKKGTTGAGHDNGAFYLETNTGALDDFVTISGIEVPEGVYKVDLIYKYNKTGRAIVQCALDEEPLADPIDLGSTTPTDGANVDGSTLLNGNQTTAGTLYSYPLTSDWESDGRGEHTFTATATKEGKIVLYGLLFTPPAALTLDKDEVTLDLLADDVTETVTATLGEGYETLSWESANDAIATVADGKDENTAVITAVGVGETTITTTAENEAGDKKTRTVEVTVTKSTAITLNRSSLSFNIGESTDPASVTATYSDLFENLTWTSDKESVAKVEGTGATVNIVPVGEGTATITATVTRKAGGGPESAELEVTVERVSRIPISLSASASPNVRTLNAAQQYVRVAASTTVGELRNALVFPKTRADGFLVQDKSGATKNDGDVLLSSDVLVVEQNGENAHYSLIVEGDETSTAITVKNNPDDFEFGMQGSNIGEITDDSITLIDGKVRRIWVADTTIPVSGADGKNDKNLAKEINKPDYTGDVGRLRALRSCDEIVEQLASANGTEQTYQIVDAKGVEKTTALPVDGDKLVVTAADGSTTKEYAISVVQAAMNGRLDLSQTEMTAGTEQTLVLEYYAGQRTPEATVDIELPAGMDAISESDITINVIGRGDVAFADFSESAGKLNADGTFENEKMHQVLGRLASDYDYQTLGTVTLSTAGGGGQTLHFTGLDLRPNNGADLRITIEGVKFDTLGDHDFSARLTTAGKAVDSTLSGLRSTGKGSETASLTVKNTVSDLKRMPYDPDLAAPAYKYENGGVTGLSYLDYNAMGELYTSAYLSWTPAADATEVKLYTAKGSVNDNGTVTPGSWDSGKEITNNGSYVVTGLDEDAYYQFKLEVTGGAHAGDSNMIEHYSGKLDATKFGLKAGEGAALARENKAALNRAISWLNSIGGGTLDIPGNGNNDAPLNYPTGTVYLKSNVYLYLETGARLHAQSGTMDGPESAWWSFGDYASGTNASEDPYANPDNFLSKQDDGHCFFQNCMIYARRADNVKIVGTGRLDGNGVLYTNDGTVYKKSPNKCDNMISFKLCTNIEIGGKNTQDDLIYDTTKAKEYVRQTETLTPGLSYKKGGVNGLADMLYIDRGGHFVMLSTGSDNVNIHDVYYQRYNTGNARDVWDFMGNRNVYAVNIFAASCSDDIIKLGSDCALGFSRPVANYKVRNIIGDTNCNNLQIGSETADDTLHVDVDNLVVLGANKAGFSISTNDGALVQDVNLNEGKTGTVYADSGYFQRTRTPIFISISHRGRIIGAENYKTPAELGDQRAVRNVAMGHVKDISFRHVKLVEAYGGSSYNKGNPADYLTYQPIEKNHSEYTSVVVGYKMPEGVTGNDMPDGRATGYVENVTFEDVELTVKGYNKDGNYPFETTENTCKELNVGQYNSPDMGVRPSYGFYVRHAKNVTFKDVKLDFEGIDGGTDDRYPIVFDDVQGATMNNVTMTKGLGVNGLVQLRESSDISLTNCKYVEKSAMDTPVAVADAANLSGGAAAADYTVYPSLRAVFDILLAVKDGAEDVKELDNPGQTVTVYTETTGSQLLGQLESKNSLILGFGVKDADGKEKDLTAALAEGDQLIVTCAADNAKVPEKIYTLIIEERPGQEPQGDSFFIPYYPDGAPAPTLRTEPDGKLAGSADGGVNYLQQKNGALGDAFLIDFPIEDAGKYRIDIIIKKGTRATVQNYLDDATLNGEVNLGDVEGLTDAGDDIQSTKAATYYYRPLTEEIALAAGTHTFKSIVTKAGDVLIYGLRLTKLSVPVTGVQVTPEAVNLYSNSGPKTAQLTAEVQPADASNKNVSWTSDNEAVATVSADGLVTVVGNGIATITATTEDGGFTDSCAVTVTTLDDPDVPGTEVPVTGIQVTPVKLQLYTNSGSKTAQLTAAVQPVNATNKNVSWTSSNEAVATVNEDGLVTVVGKGTAIITATTEDGGFSGSCEVTVTTRQDPEDPDDPDQEPDGSDDDDPDDDDSDTPSRPERPARPTRPGSNTSATQPAPSDNSNNVAVSKPDGGSVETTVSFPDVVRSDWFAPAVDFVSKNGLMTGNGGNFAPNNSLTRAMIAQVLFNMDGAVASGISSSFPDIKSGDWYDGAVAWAVSQNLMSGYGNGNFGPNDAITREQLAVVLYGYARAKGYDISISGEIGGYIDGYDISDWAAPAVRWAVGIGLLSGKSGGRLDPTGTATRAEVAQLLMIFCQKVAK